MDTLPHGPRSVCEVIHVSNSQDIRSVALARAADPRNRRQRGLVDIAAHLRGDPGLGEFAQPDRMDAWILILILDLGAAFLDAYVGASAFRADPALEHDRIALGAETDGDIARRPGAGAEVLVEHVVGRRETHAVAPVDALEIPVALVPEQRVARAVDEEDVQAGPVPVPLLVS